MKKICSVFNYVKQATKLSLLIACILIATLLQIVFNWHGYNFYTIPFLLLIVLYFNEIKKISCFGFSIEKLQKISTQVRSDIIGAYEAMLYSASHACFIVMDNTGCPIISNYEPFMELIAKITILPHEIKIALNVTVKEYAKKLADQQNNRSKSFGKNWDDSQREKAAEAYNKLRSLADEGVLYEK